MYPWLYPIQRVNKNKSSRRSSDLQELYVFHCEDDCQYNYGGVSSIVSACEKATGASVGSVKFSREGVSVRIDGAVGGTGVLLGTGVSVGGTGVLVGTGVSVGGTGVLVGMGVSVGGIGVLVGMGVSVGGTGVLVGTGVFVGTRVNVSVGIGITVARDGLFSSFGLVLVGRIVLLLKTSTSSMAVPAFSKVILT